MVRLRRRKLLLRQLLPKPSHPSLSLKLKRKLHRRPLLPLSPPEERRRKFLLTLPPFKSSRKHSVSSRKNKSESLLRRKLLKRSG